MSAVDLHSHVIPPTMIEALRRDPDRYGLRIEERDGRLWYTRHGQVAELRPDYFDADAKVEWAERRGIRVSAISIGPPVYFYWLSPDVGLEAARLNNDGIARMVARRPDRLRGMAALPMQDPDAAVVELERVVRDHGFKAVEIGTSVEGSQISEPRYRPVLKRIAELGCFVFAHPYACAARGGMDGYYLRNFIGFPLDTTLMVANLMYSGALDDLPGLRILLAHGGGYVPYQIGRFVHGHRVRPEAKVATQTSPADLMSHFWYDALTHDPQATRHLIDRVGADRVVIGTDHPFDMGPDRPIEDLDAVPRLTPEERERIVRLNALALLGET